MRLKDWKETADSGGVIFGKPPRNTPQMLKTETLLQLRKLTGIQVPGRGSGFRKVRYGTECSHKQFMMLRSSFTMKQAL